MSTDITHRERMTLLGAALGLTKPAPGVLGCARTIYECPVGRCTFKGSQEEIEQHQVDVHRKKLAPVLVKR